ncbi:hypothetical protein NA56DRAFT_708028 [Hyaloscypha hepaticicola]|uniref:Uncharacterized protein n=1 Tax=Hyaloscypha hepaticicola TaxID=2082293 RepID=A0A2J6PSZ5_9HELO|nr:hypothetical protein NA56DRAFT_708028 [Hyaloscypha hepaticicola]
MDIQQLLNTPPRRLPSEIPETPAPIPFSQLTTQSWDSQNGPRPPIPFSQLTTQSWDSQNGPRPLTPFSQLTTQSWDSRNGPRPSRESLLVPVNSQNNLSQTPSRKKGPYDPTLTRSDRIRIKTALDFNISPERIWKKYGYSLSQIQRTKYSRLTPQVHRRGRKYLIGSPTCRELANWVEESPSRRYVTFKHIPYIAPPRFALQDRKEQAIRTAFKLVGYGRRVAPKKGFSDDPMVMRERVEFAEERKTWTPQRLFNQIFSDEVWAMGGAYTRAWVTVKEDGSDRFDPACIKYK